jgi:hypothetical protein
VTEQEYQALANRMCVTHARTLLQHTAHLDAVSTQLCSEALATLRALEQRLAEQVRTTPAATPVQQIQDGVHTMLHHHPI